MELARPSAAVSAAHAKQLLTVKDGLVHASAATFARFNVLPSKRVITQKQECRLEEMIGEELGHKWAVEISRRFMRVSLQFIAAFSSS